MEISSCPCKSISSRLTVSPGFSKTVTGRSKGASSAVYPPSISLRVSMNAFLIEGSSEIACFQKRRLMHWRITRNGSDLHSPHGPVLAMAAASTARQQYAERSKYEQDAKVIQVHTVKQFDEALAAAKSKLVVVEYAASHSANSRKIYPSMVELSLTCQDAVFLLVMGDESGETKELCKRVGVEKVPHFVFYKNKEIIHEEEGIGPDELLGDVLYYGDPDAPILQLHSKEGMDDLIQKHAEDGKLLVVDVGLKHCGPCVKVYPTFVKLAKKMKDTTVFARINGDENDELMELLKQMDVVEVPTFLFIRDGKLSGRYVGSGKGDLIGEILRYQGVRVTY